jgi:acyl carrier protein
MSAKDALLETIAAVFQIEPNLLSEDSSFETVKGWDSLGQIRLMTELEICFSVEFDLMDIPNLKSVRQIRAKLTEKGALPAFGGLA